MTNDNHNGPKLERPAAVACSDLLARMVEIIKTWRKRAGRKFKDAAIEKNVMGKRLIEHGAMCYFNCSEELQTLVDELAASATQPKSKTTKTLRA